jgi:hypothetical protein
MSKAAKEKVNHTNPGKKEAYHGAKLGHDKGSDNADINLFVGKDARVKAHETTGPDAGHTHSSQAPRATGAAPVRIREYAGFAKVNHGGSHVKNATKE